jgi:hypothetical protein
MPTRITKVHVAHDALSGLSSAERRDPLSLLARRLSCASFLLRPVAGDGAPPPLVPRPALLFRLCTPRSRPGALPGRHSRLHLPAFFFRQGRRINAPSPHIFPILPRERAGAASSATGGCWRPQDGRECSTSSIFPELSARCCQEDGPCFFFLFPICASKPPESAC